MKLLIFTQKVDSGDSDLGFFHEWIREFAKKADSVKVICLYKGTYDLPSNVEVLSLGKEMGLSKFSYLVNLYKHLRKLNGSYDRVFVHMNPVYVVLCGLYFKFKNIPVYLWYVHRSVDFKLRVAILFVKKVFTSAKESFRIDTDKVVFLGHGIDVSKLPNTSHKYEQGVINISHVGRITPIKNIEVLLDACKEIKLMGKSVSVTFLGEPVTLSDVEYKRRLETKIREESLQNEVIFAGASLYTDLPGKLTKSHLTVNLTPSGGMDKVVLESLALGLPVFTSNTAFIDLLGDYEGLFLFEYQNAKDLSNKILNYLESDQEKNIIENLSEKVRQEFGLENLVSKMTNIMK